MPPFVSALLVAFVVGFVVTQIATFGTTVYLHRGLSHKALTMRPFVAWCFRASLWLTTGIRPREWVAVHRKHHAFTDVEGDPHSPKLLGWVTVQFGNVGLYRKVATDPTQVRKYARDLPGDRWDRVLFDRSWLGLSIGIAILVIVFGPWVGLLAAALHAGMYLSLNAAVNAITHTFGDRPHDNSATNLQWLALLTAGEGLHNNHHAAPTSAKLAFNKRELDPSWPAIALAVRLRLMTIRHADLKLKQPVAA
ncbi:MAG TPA: fatty acid desaturase [Acidimicrobiales bacterium]|nr:fatty acid desaturase [Acidimicrobiales bacterium]